jgi:NAD(P)-dependent dehydrogenase (short-subunit alcohol dehydrogenase family)
VQSIEQLMDMRGRVALVTGGAGHIGRAICDTLAELGADIAVLDHPSQGGVAESARLNSTYGVRTMSLAQDLAEEKSIRAVPTAVFETLGGLDVLVNCAALAPAAGTRGWAVPFAQQTSEAWRLAFEVNLTAVFVLTQSCVDMLRRSRRGCVVNVASIYGMVGPDMRLYDGTAMGNPAAYAASKGGLLQLTRWLATALAPAIRVNSITPGGVWRNQPESFHERYRARTPLQRMASEEDLKGAVAYLSSDLSAYVTGHNLVVDGGWTTW